MDVVDPTYPLHPIARILAAVMLLAVLVTSFIRRTWNLGVTFLCIWLFFANVCGAINEIIWSNNADIKLYVYCDIVSHLSMITYTVKPMATLIIMRRLHLIASLQPMDRSKAERRWNLVVEWTLGLLIPLLIAGPVYYVHQGYRFKVYEGFGCEDATQLSVLEILTVGSWTVVPPLASIIFYYPNVVRTFYRQRLDTTSFLNNNESVSPTCYLRILILASIDILLTLPIGIISIVLGISSWVADYPLPLYWGWTTLHEGWEPISLSYAQLKVHEPVALAQLYFASWSSPLLSFTIFGLFGMSSDARASYRRIGCVLRGWSGWRKASRAQKGQASLGEIDFGRPAQDLLSLDDLEIGLHRQSVLTSEASAAKQNMATYRPEARPASSSDSESESTKEVRRHACDTREVEHRVSSNTEPFNAAVEGSGPYLSPA